MIRISKQELITNFGNLGIEKDDIILIRADLGKVGKIQGGANIFIEALLEVIGTEGTMISLAFTNSSFLKKPKIEDAFHKEKKSYAGALPNAMLKHPQAYRSTHPMCSYVAIGKYAKYLTENHNETSPAYEPIREIINLNGKNLLIGCVSSSPGFTSTHLAEHDLGMTKFIIFPKLSSTFYKTAAGDYKLFRRKDPGLCSDSYWKFYAYYVKEGLLATGYIGNAYSILAPSKECFELEKNILHKNKDFNICDSPTCFVCNGRRWDRIYKLPFFAIKYFLKYLTKGK